MRFRIQLILFLGLFWVFVFQCCRVIFYLYQLGTGTIQPFHLLPQAAWHGLRMDISMAAYLLILPTLLLAFTAYRWVTYRKLILGFGLVSTFCVSLIVACDLPVFRSWGFRLDTTPLHYLSQPAEALVSASASPLFLLAMLFMLLFASTTYFYDKLVSYYTSRFQRTKPYRVIPLFLLLSGLLIVPIRGGLQLAPMNQSAVYFSKVNFANQMAVNAPWIFFNSIVQNTGNQRNEYLAMSESEAIALLDGLGSKSIEQSQLLKTGFAQNVVLIIWESFTAKVAGVMGGVPGVTPEFDALAREGILFDNIYASGERSDKGLIAILSAYPAQPVTSIITVPAKTSTLPSIPGYLRQKGYVTSFHYGGETEFANMKSYLVQDRFDRIVDKNDFQKSEMNSKWGAHDHVVFNRFLQYLQTQPRPFFSTLFTLSSHEPFDVPVATVFEGQSQAQQFLNSLHYADASLGQFIRQAKTESWWDSTLVVIIADHGHPLPESPGGKPPQYQIPMLWLGGALNKDSLRIDNLGSQTDLAATLLEQLGYRPTEFRWSNNLLRRDRTPYAFFTFNNGFGWITPTGRLVYDNVGKQKLTESRDQKPTDMRRAQAYQQILAADYLSR